MFVCLFFVHWCIMGYIMLCVTLCYWTLAHTAIILAHRNKGWTSEHLLQHKTHHDTLILIYTDMFWFKTLVCEHWSTLMVSNTHLDKACGYHSNPSLFVWSKTSLFSLIPLLLVLLHPPALWELFTSMGKKNSVEHCESHSKNIFPSHCPLFPSVSLQVLLHANPSHTNKCKWRPKLQNVTWSPVWGMGWIGPKEGLINLSTEAMGPLGISSLLYLEEEKEKDQATPFFLSREGSASFSHLC